MKPIVVEQSYDLPVSVAWKAITEHHQMIQWFFEDIPEFKAEVGFKTRFNVSAPSQDYVHLWEISEVIPLKKIVYEWSYENIQGHGKVIFELIKTNNGSLIRLSNFGLESFPKDLPEFTEESCIGGWTYFIKERLKSYLETKK